MPSGIGSSHSDALFEAYDIGIEKFSGLHTTHISLYEFLRGLAYLGKKASEYKTYIEASIEPLPLDNRAVTTASEVYAKLRKAGSLVEDPDLLIASICIANAIPIVTGNVKHFERFREHGLSIRPMDNFLAPVRGT